MISVSSCTETFDYDIEACLDSFEVDQLHSC